MMRAALMSWGKASAVRSSNYFAHMSPPQKQLAFSSLSVLGRSRRKDRVAVASSALSLSAFLRDVEFRHSAVNGAFRRHQFPRSFSSGEGGGKAGRPPPPNLGETSKEKEGDQPVQKENFLVRMGGKTWGLFKRYGLVAFGTYYTLYFGTGIVAYVGFTSGVIPDLDMAYIFQFLNQKAVDFQVQEKLGINVPAILWEMEYFVGSYPEYKHFTMAFLVTELSEPIRYPLVLLLTPKIARMLGRAPVDEEAAKDSAKKM